MTLLVTGGDRVDAGKTTFVTGLLAHLRRSSDVSPRGFKPRAGNDYWFDHDDVLDAIDHRRLYGKDAARIASSEDRKRAPEDLNPLHRLWKPTPGRTGLLGAPNRSFLVDRLRRPDGTDEFVVNGTVELPAAVRRALPLESATEIEAIEAFNELMGERYLPAFEQLADDVREAGLAVVESYGDIALPLRGITFDAVAVVEPGRVEVYDGRRWLRACEIASGTPHEGQLEERTADVTELVEVETRTALPALPGAERADPARVADAYADAYLDLLAVVG